MRDSGSTSCVVRTDLVRETQKTGTTSLCMLIDGTVKRYPTAIVELDKHWSVVEYRDYAWMIQCMTSSFIGNVPEAKDPQLICESSTPMTIVLVQ